MTVAGLWVMIHPDTIPALRWRLGLSPYDAASYKGELHKYHQDQLAHAQQISVVLLGDSHMQRLDAATLHPYTVNLGIGGLRSDELMENLPAYQRLNEADHIIVSIGLNDLEHATRAEFEKTVAALIQKLNDRQRPWVLLEIMPVDPAQPQDVTNDEIEAANMVLRSSCVAPCQFVETWGLVSDDDGNLNVALHEGDGQHLNREGYALLIERLQDFLGKASQ
ncbi:MAG: GDSL-type esterase/lipase family protein [Aquisalinus sp.]|nr:GDSL-type esterase/lipase family protein [Aquisalinus sp.]